MKEDHWNYRVMRHRVGEYTHYGLHEVYYKNGKPWLWSQNPEIQADTVEEIEELLLMMYKDYRKSKHDILDFEGIKKEE